MKVLITGASGSIGGAALLQCLEHPDITTVIAFLRKELPTEIARNSKLQTVIVQDFSSWPEIVLRAHSDAASMIW
jgi:FlaA1/EpsC-like NDP-sugar epimerase